MPCYHPLRAWLSKGYNNNGKRYMVFNKNSANDPTRPVELPCGRCIGCRLEYSRQWAIRCTHESQMHEENCVLTLTYNDENLPENGSLVKEDLQKFFKRLRKQLYPKQIRYFACGEYGEDFSRPHYHVIIFGHQFPDRKLFKTSKKGTRLYISEVLEKIWPFGHSLIGDYNFESAAYVARYMTKKIKGDQAEEHYQDRIPEFVLNSRKPPIGQSWFDKYKDDVFPNDFVIVNGKKISPPLFYTNQLPENLKKEIKKERKFEAIRHSDNATLKRLDVRHDVKMAKISLLRREFEND